MILQAGQLSDIHWNSGPWIFLDIGFSNSSKTCGIALGDAPPECKTYAAAKSSILEHIDFTDNEKINLVIEAPLSVCFSPSGNPKGRSIEKAVNNSPRYWYTGAGVAVMVAAMYLVKEIDAQRSKKSIRLFEGFVTYKDRKVKSDHIRDVLLLREVVDSPERFGDCIIAAEELKQHHDDNLVSAFSILGVNGLGIPPVIRRSVTFSESKP